MKKLISILLILLMLAMVFVSCNTDGKDDEANSGTSESKEEISSEQQNTSETTQEVTTEEKNTLIDDGKLGITLNEYQKNI